jgi:hypothetical protein
MSTQHHSNEQQQDTGLTTMFWLGGALLVVGIFAFFYLGM